MPPCSPDSNSINPPVVPGIPIPNFGLPFAPIQIPFPGISLPTGLIQDLQALVSELGLVFPSSTFKPTVGNFTKTIFDFISNLLTQIAPFMSFYNFIMALFNLIICIIEVLCAIPNPFKIASAMVKLFTQCLPPFLRLFPWLALIMMIIALLLLILALIEYLIATILGIIAEIVRNLLILGDGITFQDADSTLSAIAKLADLLCLIQNILAILVALAAIIGIIEALAQFAGGAICDDSNANGCCSPDVCPPFIKDGPITGAKGQLKYYSQIGIDVASALSISPDVAALFNIPPIRTERWQFIDTDTTTLHHFGEIITPILDTTQFPPVESTFWPEGVVYDGYTAASKMPYNVDLRINMDPKQFVLSDTKGKRFMRIKGTGTIRKPYFGLLNQQEQIDSLSLTNPAENAGTLNLVSGLVYEDDGTTAYMVDGSQATLNTFIHTTSPSSTTKPTVDDGIIFDDVEFTFTPNYGVLMGYVLITAGCLPDIRIEKNIMNSVLIAEDVRAVVQKLQPTPDGVKVPSAGFLPNVAGAQQCVLDSLASFRKDVSIEGAANFQAAVQTCLGDLRNQTLFTVCGAIVAAVSQFNSTAVLDTDVQFTSRPIDVNVVLRDPTGSNLCTNVPVDCLSSILSKLEGDVTFGEITDFTFDGYSSFNAKITSSKSGKGNLTVSFDGKIFSSIIPPVAATATTAGISSQIEENIIPYTFIDSPAEPGVRRNAADVAGDNSDKE